MHTLKSEKNILLVFAHPDDHILVVGTILKYKSLGYKIHEVLFTSGQHGVINGQKIEKDKAGKIRLLEYSEAIKKLGIDSFMNLGQEDGFVKWCDVDVLKITHLIRKLKPEIVISFEEKDLHPDHTMSAKMAFRAVQLANISVDLEAGESRFRVPKFLQVFGYVQGDVNYMVDTSDFFHIKHEILKIYASQNNPKMVDTIESIDRRNALISPAKTLEGFKIHLSWPVIEG